MDIMFGTGQTEIPDVNIRGNSIAGSSISPSSETYWGAISPHSPGGSFMSSFSPGNGSRRVGERMYTDAISINHRNPPSTPRTMTSHRNNNYQIGQAARGAMRQRWVVQKIVGSLSVQDVLAAAQVSRMWNHVVDSHLRLWHRLASFFSTWDADKIVNDPKLDSERRQLLEVLSESCDFLRGVGIPRSNVLAHMRGSTKRLPPSVKLLARLVQLLLTPWLALPKTTSKKKKSDNVFFENITSLLKDVPKTSTYIVAAHRSFASRGRMVLPLSRAVKQEILALSKRKQLLKPSRLPAPYRQLCEWTRAMMTCVSAAEQWQQFVIKHLKMPVVGALRRHAGYAAETIVPISMACPTSPTSLSTPPLLAGASPSPRLSSSPPPPPPEYSRELIAGYANRNYQYHSSPGASKLANKMATNQAETLLDSPLRRISSPVETAALQLLSVIESDRTLYGNRIDTPGGLFDAIDRDGYGFVTKDQIRAAFHRLDVELGSDTNFLEFVEILASHDRAASMSKGMISRESFKQGVMRLSWHLRPLSVMSRKLSWQIAGDLTAMSDRSRGNGDLSNHSASKKMDARVWSAYMPLVRQLRTAVRHNRRVFGHEIQKISDYFEAVDTNKDGSIGLDEFRAALRRLDMGTFMSVESIEDTFNAIDLDSSGTIDRTEFMAAMAASMTKAEIKRHAGFSSRSQKEGTTKDKKTNSRHGGASPHTNSATRRRTLFANENPFTVHNSGSGGKIKSTAIENHQHRTKQLTSAQKSSRKQAAKRKTSSKSASISKVLSESDEKKIRSKLKAAAYTSNGVDWKKLFNFYDRDNSGAVDFDEFKQLLRSDAKISKSHLSDKDVKILFDAVDIDGSGEIDWFEFNEWVDAEHYQGRHNKITHGGLKKLLSGGHTVKRSSSNSMLQRSPSRSPSRGMSRNGKVDASEAQVRVFNRLQALRREHEERLAAAEERFAVEVKRLSSRVENANIQRHRDVGRAMDEMDDMRRRLIDAHERAQEMLHTQADEQIAQLERERIVDAAEYESRIARLENECSAMVDAASSSAEEASEMRNQLEQEKLAYRRLEMDHASELRDLMQDRHEAEEVGFFFKSFVIICMSISEF